MSNLRAPLLLLSLALCLGTALGAHGLAPASARAAGPSGPPGSNDPADSALQDQIQSVLEQRHPTDTPDWWRGLGPRAPRVIISMYQASTHVYHRLRLMQALGWFDDPVAAEFLRRQAQDADDDVIRNASIRSLGISQGAKAVDFVAKFLQSDDAQTRFTAAATLKRIGDARSEELLQKFLSNEKVAWVRTKVLREPVEPLSPPLKVVKRIDRKLNPDFSGRWSGFWVEPRAGSGSSGMRSDPVSLELAIDADGLLGGDLKLRFKPEGGGAEKTLVYRLENSIGKDDHVTGVFVRHVPRSGQKPLRVELAFEAELAKKDKLTVLHIVMPKSLATLALRKEGR